MFQVLSLSRDALGGCLWDFKRAGERSNKLERNVTVQVAMMAEEDILPKVYRGSRYKISGKNRWHLSKRW